MPDGHDLRVEAVTAGEAVKSYPRCIGGRRGGSREACGGPWAFMEAEQRRPSALVRAAQILGVLLDGDPDERLSHHRDEVDELAELYPMVSLCPEPFDRRAVNRRLTELDWRKKR